MEGGSSLEQVGPQDGTSCALGGTEGQNSGTLVVSQVKTSPGHVDKGTGWAGDPRPGHWLCSPRARWLWWDVDGKVEWWGSSWVRAQRNYELDSFGGWRLLFQVSPNVPHVLVRGSACLFLAVPFLRRSCASWVNPPTLHSEPLSSTKALCPTGEACLNWLSACWQEFLKTVLFCLYVDPRRGSRMGRL